MGWGTLKVITGFVTNIYDPALHSKSDYQFIQSFMKALILRLIITTLRHGIKWLS